MRDALATRMRRARELAFALCAAWLLLQNLALFVMFAWQPVTAVIVTTQVLVRVAWHAAAPLTTLPGGELLEAARTLLGPGTEVRHG